MVRPKQLTTVQIGAVRILQSRDQKFILEGSRKYKLRTVTSIVDLVVALRKSYQPVDFLDKINVGKLFDTIFLRGKTRNVQRHFMSSWIGYQATSRDSCMGINQMLP